MRFRSRQRNGDEQGASLIIALAFVATFSIAIGAALDFAGATFRLDKRSQERQAELYGVNGALDFAINAMRSDSEWGAEGICAGNIFVLEDGRTATVECEAQPGSGFGSADVPGAIADGAPDHALLAYSGAAEDSITITEGTLFVDGPVVANSDIETAEGTALNSGLYDVHAAGTCDINQVTHYTCSEPIGTEIDDAFAKVGQPSWINRTARTAPACLGDAKYYALQPGWYTDAAALTALTSGGDDCEGSVVHLLPGKFVFDFSQEGYGAQWRITDATATVVAGTALGWATPAHGADAPEVPTSGACATESAGTLLSFLGESALFVGASNNVEFCGLDQPSGQNIAIFGPSAVTDDVEVQTDCIVLPKGCPFIMVTSTGGEADGTLRVHGTVFAPTASIGLDMSDGVVAVFDRGTLVRSVYFDSSSTSEAHVFSVPHAGPSGGHANRLVVLTVTIDGVEVGRAKVEFVDVDASDDLSVGLAVIVLEWDTH